MTDAQIIDRNQTSCEETPTTTSTELETANNDNETTSSHNNSNCDTISDLETTPNNNLVTLQVPFNDTAQNHINSTTESEVPKCNEDHKATTNECPEQVAPANEILKSDTVLKYVYKANDKVHVSSKTKPHPINSLRKRRSLDNNNKLENITANESKNAPLIVDYETLHSPKDIEVVVPLHQRLTGENIQNGALADFSIETLHNTKSKENENSQSSEESDERAKYENNNSRINESVEKENSSEDKESIENDNFTRNERNRKGKDNDNESSSREHYESKKNHDNYDSKERNESHDSDENEKHLKTHKYPLQDPYTRNKNNKDNALSKEASFEKYEENDEVRPLNLPLHSAEPNSDENSENGVNKESRENVHSLEDDRSSYKDSQESNENQDYRDNDKTKYKQESHEKFDSEKQTKLKPTQENSYGNEEDDIQLRHKQLKDNDLKEEKNKKPETPLNSESTRPTNLNVDSGDFSYEKIQLNDKGQVVTAEDTDDIEPLVAHNKPETDTHLSQLNKQTSSEEISGEFISNLKYKIDKEPTHINDGEVKPVVEINSENNELREENIKEDFKSNLDEDISLETLLGTGEKNLNLKKDNEAIKKKEIENADVKQEFERIPTDYKHKNKNQNENQNEAQNENQNGNQNESQNENQNENDENSKSSDESYANDDTSDIPHTEEGTLDTLKPIDVNYDEHLKFKFDDISIKLPEIKLPDDVLGYSYEGPVYANQKKKQNVKEDKDKFNQFSNDSPSKHKKTEQDEDDGEDDDHRYYGYYGKEDKKQSYKQKQDDSSEEDNDHEDLYEKFVRERFGKKGSFLKRTEKLQDGRIVPNDGKLYDTVKNILKQTENIQKQADKSGDPNAGYMWTLEYGEKL